jgi:hypothetical protein
MDYTELGNLLDIIFKQLSLSYILYTELGNFERSSYLLSIQYSTLVQATFGRLDYFVTGLLRDRACLYLRRFRYC